MKSKDWQSETRCLKYDAIKRFHNMKDGDTEATSRKTKEIFHGRFALQMRRNFISPFRIRLICSVGVESGYRIT